MHIQSFNLLFISSFFFFIRPDNFTNKCYVLQRSHIVTGDDAHYVAVIQELEYRGARVLPIFCGGLDFSKPVNEFYYDSINKDQPIVDGVVSLTGFALVGGPARQDHPKAVEALKRLNRPYMVALPLVFQTTQEWEMKNSLKLYTCI